MTQLMTMRDIAGLARVQRPVVSVWRRRSRATAHPFPPARQKRDGQEFFLRDDVVAWLEDTQRGNNPEARADAAAHSLLAGGSTKDAETISALVTLRQLIGEPLAPLQPDDLLDLADEHDPDDRYFRREMERCADLARFARDADDLVEASWGELTAHQHLVETRLRTPGSALSRTVLSDAGRRFLLGLIGPLAAELGHPGLMDPTGAAVDLLAECATSLELPVRVMDGDTGAQRLTRRQLLLAGVRPRLVERGRGEWSMTDPTAHLVVLPSAAEPQLDELGQLEFLDEIVLQLTADQLVLCLAPAATLTDPLTGTALAKRDQLLRGGHVRAIVRLPAGLRPAQAREHSALWLLGSPDPTPVGERRTLVADLGGVQLRQCEGLADDLLAAWQGSRGARRRAWAQLHPVFTALLVSASDTLVPPRPQRAVGRSRAGADWAVELRAADTAERLKPYRFDVLDQVAEGLSVAQAIARGWLRVLSGRKVDVSGLAAGTVPVVSDPAAPGAMRRVDRLALLARVGGELTEPGDIIFSVRPKPSAVIDEEGGTLVLAPARILRVRSSAPLVARAVAARINAATSSTWRTWPLAVVPEPTRDVLGEALTDLAAQRARLVAELAGLDALTTDLTTAVESRQLSISKENHGPTSH
ncbi:hypothetical protein [Propionicimonas sp.]|uniref:hypothetical protein n=1 Tax=Propionicimonas sp. TaxID=1955623 RepID=UPI001825E257|nr:hypothetical protein [Propionicimonas sp.]MBU3976115.1 hypothetical protein [Actinomycetota bacterium]MBA3020928.1 hypothetical protein [Propionicimonas sp.]MBU3985305.1 hypothetical protein [Actinomycetota bacterium]MBU4008295.1 hypothetical protein [Actinomycetota bacterium]MBU4064491.1 hypothetical protein [Actinomycetota bacterium]